MAIAPVGNATIATNGGSAANIAANARTITAGNANYIPVWWGSSDVAITVAGVLGNTYTEILHTFNTNFNEGFALFEALNVAGGSETPTATFGGFSRPDLAIGQVEFSGVVTSSAADVDWVAATVTATTNLTCGAQTVAAGSLIVCAGVFDVASATPGSGFTEVYDVAAVGGYFQYKVSAGGSETANCTLATSGGGSIDASARKAAGGGGGGGKVSRGGVDLDGLGGVGQQRFPRAE